MISSSTLQAFSPGIKTGQSSVQALRVSALSKTAAAAQKTLQSLPSGISPGQPAPRGSLLDLSV